MEKQGIPINNTESPPPPYSIPEYPVAGQPPASGAFDSGCQKAPLYPVQNLPEGPVVGYQVPPGQGMYCTQQPMGYSQQPTFVYVQPQPLVNPPQDHLVYSIFVTVCCCWIIGLFAILRSSECRSAVAAGDRTTAEIKSGQAKRLANIALGLGIVCTILVITIFGVYYGLMFSRLNY